MLPPCGATLTRNRYAPMPDPTLATWDFVGRNERKEDYKQFALTIYGHGACPIVRIYIHRLTGSFHNERHDAVANTNDL